MAIEVLESSQVLIDRFIELRPPDSKLVFHHVPWEEYEALLNQLVDPAGLRITFDNGTLQITTASVEHENYARFLDKIIGLISVRQRIRIRSFGSATMRKHKKLKGNEPDACFYVQSVPLIGNRVDLDFEVDPPPDIVVEIDLHRDSISKFSIYAALDVGEIWRYDGVLLKIDVLQGQDYVPATQSRALPLLTTEILTDFLRRMREDEFQALIEFDEWIQKQGA